MKFKQKYYQKCKAVFLVLIAIILSVSALAAKPKYVRGKLVKGDVDGCGWLIVTDDSKILDPINIQKFKVKLKAGKRVKFNFIIPKSTASICMMGQIIELTKIK